MKFYRTPARIYALDSQGALAAEIRFSLTGNKVYCITHTFVDSSLGGQGIASQLVCAAVDQIHAYGGTVTATCSYASQWLARHPDALK